MTTLEISPDIIDRFNTNPLYQTMGIRLEEAVDGKARSFITPKAQVCWPTPDQPHGGILFTTMDTTMAWAVISLVAPDYSCTTIDCHIQYPAPAKEGPFLCQAWTTHQTGRLTFVRADISDSRQTLVATGQATFRVIKMNFI
ncbi:MAG: hypothetical protein C0407_14200 [Desulfobacca sp.]|nr:hypothetical protein [Desulfobacca sp.]